MSNIITEKAVANTITIRNGIEVVRGDKLAKVFEKQHKHIIEKIENLVSEFSDTNIDPQKYFIRTTYQKRGKDTKVYYLTRKGFDLVALSLTGKNALMYKIWYIDAFHDKQRVIEEHKLTLKLNHQEDLWVQFREEGKVFRKKLTKAIKDTIVSYREEVERKQNDGRYYQNYTKLIYKKLGIDLPKGANPRDILDKRMLVRLEDLEDRVADMILSKSKKGIYYKDVYKEIKEELR